MLCRPLVGYAGSKGRRGNQETSVYLVKCIWQRLWRKEIRGKGANVVQTSSRSAVSSPSSSVFSADDRKSIYAIG